MIYEILIHLDLYYSKLSGCLAEFLLPKKLLYFDRRKKIAAKIILYFSFVWLYGDCIRIIIIPLIGNSSFESNSKFSGLT